MHIDPYAFATYIFVTFFAYFIYIYIMDDIYWISAHHFTFKFCFTSFLFYSVTLGSSFLCLMLDLLLLAISKFIYTDTRDIVREHVLKKGASKIDDDFI